MTTHDHDDDIFDERSSRSWHPSADTPDDDTARDVTARLAELSSDKTLAALADLAVAIVRAREIHPEGVNVAVIASETGELATATLRETPERVRAEALDVAVVALRLYLGEWSDPVMRAAMLAPEATR